MDQYTYDLIQRLSEDKIILTHENKKLREELKEQKARARRVAYEHLEVSAKCRVKIHINNRSNAYTWHTDVFKAVLRDEPIFVAIGVDLGIYPVKWIKDKYVYDTTEELGIMNGNGNIVHGNRNYDDGYRSELAEEGLLFIEGLHHVEPTDR